MPTASCPKCDIVFSAPTESIHDILRVLTKNDDEGELRELSGPAQTSAVIIRAIGKYETPCQLGPPGSPLTRFSIAKNSQGTIIETSYLQSFQTAGSCEDCQGLKNLSPRGWGIG
ncbi:hypothetical protein KSB_63430 [Ktedonobacter robiniae]|uniref:Uncharacterized protein n=1 Tax=Ktedonobacter robiniae TaxID=2778365 RepID=A0ABQ3UYK2_9CHLR|nr:hypothetical protein KSB_63430 [Ktedonobacter robiniae]